MRKKMNLSMAMVKARLTDVVSGSSTLGPAVLDAAWAAGRVHGSMAAMANAAQAWRLIAIAHPP
jgi:hypothetical protein